MPYVMMTSAVNPFTILTQLCAQAASALVGAAGSLLVAWYYDRGTSPQLEVMPDDGPRLTGQQPVTNNRHQFLQVKVRQRRGPWPFRARRAAWNCRAIFDVFRQDGSRAVDGSVTARWSGSLQPYRTQIVQGSVAQIPEMALLPVGERFDIHPYSEEQVGVAVKFEAGEDCWIFSNASYLFPRWQNPNWILPRGTYFIRMSVHYEASKPTIQWLLLSNNGPRFEDWGITLVPGPPF